MLEMSRRTAVGAALLLALGGCATGGATQPGGAPGTPVDGGTLRYGAVAASGGTAVTDPHGSLFNESDWVRMGALYDVLTVPGDNGAVLPRLASSWTSEENATRWRFELRTDAVFSDGKPVRAADVLHSLRRIAAKAAQNGGRLGTVDIDKSTADGDHAVVLRTTQPDADLPRTLAGVTFVVPDGVESFENPVGSGPFTLSTMDGQTAVLARNDKWWGKRPHLDQLEIRGFADPQALAAAVTSGEVDVAANVSPAAAKTAERTGNLVVSRRPGATTYPMLMRLDKAPFDRPEVRRAVKLAVDRQALVDGVLLGYGTTGGDVPGGPDVPPPARDITEARRVLSSVGSVVLHTTTAYPGMVSAATLLATQLGEAGMKVEVRQHPPETYWTQVYTVEPLAMGYYTDVPFPVWVRQTALSTSAFNETGWKNADFDAEFAAAMAVVDQGQREAQLKELRERMAADGGWLVWGFGDGLDVSSPAVQGLPTSTGFARIFLDGVWLRR
ncbi:ABC transporter substrate-binding protein [Saccharothrix deserti]|uniref:ABC transporter substrate-binding protein n=1 Tax=Saccharothrix deserti TaxID=2593674 RepID=UPI00192E631C|nr:ABC transporter substrate-binding protein [Saccharothrix deserti]